MACSSVAMRLASAPAAGLRQRKIACRPLGLSALRVARLPVPAPSRPNVQAAALFHKEDPVPVDPEHPELATLRSNADYKVVVSRVSFWVQLALTLASSGVLVFAASVGKPAWPTAFTAFAIVLGFLSLAFPWAFKDTGKKMKGGETITPSYISGNLLRCNAINIVGVLVTAIALQASVGTLAAKSLMTNLQAPAATAAANVVISLDVYALQAATNILLSHVVSLIWCNLMFRYVRSARYPAGGVALGSWDGISPRGYEA